MLHHQECTSQWSCNKIFRLLLHLDRSLMHMCSLEFMCPGSSSPIRTASDCSLHQDQNFPGKVGLRIRHRFVPNLHASVPSSSHHSMHLDSSHRQTRNCQGYVCADSCVSELVSDFGFSRPVFELLHCTNLWHSWNLALVLWMSRLPDLPCSFLCQHSWTMTCSVYLTCHCLCEA